MKNLVVGGNGFMGTHLVDGLLREGHSVRTFDRSSNQFRAMSPDVDYVQGELNNHSLVREAVEDVEVVYHLISTTLPKTSNSDPIYDIHSNLADSVRLFEACVDAGVRKVVFASSGGTIYGTSRYDRLREDHPTEPITSYGIVKLAIEKYLNLFNKLHGLDFAALRISNPYGPYQDPSRGQGVISVFLQKILLGETITVWGNGKVVRDYLYVSDLADALISAAETQTGTKVLNIGSGRGASLNDLIEYMAIITDSKPMVEYLPARAFDVPVNILDIRQAREELFWSPRTDLADGIEKTWEWLSTLAQSRTIS